jgi:23S rRNA (uridine2552-2'-O)-methyltransferase
MAFLPQDFFFKKDKKENFLARSIYKLEEIVHKFNIPLKNKFVFDCGASPGSWCQYLLKSDVKKIIALDLQPLKIAHPNLQFFQKDFYEIMTIKDLFIDQHFDLIVSDMAPNTIGHKDTDHLKSIDLTEHLFSKKSFLLKQSGHMICKVFEGRLLDEFIRKEKKSFKSIQLFRPEAIRSMSSEIYIIAKGYTFS